MLTWPGVLFAVLAGAAQFGAAWYCWTRPLTPLERRGIGVAIMLIAFSAGWSLDTTAHPPALLVQVAVLSGIGTALCYRLRSSTRAAPSDTPEADALMDKLKRELGEE
jgi:hypothetical protein